MKVIGGLRDYLLQLGNTFAYLWIITFIIIFSDALSYPAIPYLIKGFLIEEIAVVATLGLLSSAFNITKVAANILGVFLGDRVSKDILVFITLNLLPPSFALILFARNHLWILCSYILFGVFYGVLMPLLNALVAETAQMGVRGVLFGIFNLSWIIGQIIAPIVGGHLSDTVFLRFPLILSLILSLVTLTLFLAFRGLLRNISLPRRSAGEKDEGAGSPAKTLLLLCSIQLLSGLGSGVLSVVSTAFLIYVLGASPTEIGFAYSLGWAIAAAMAQIPGGKLSDKFGFKPVMMASTLISAPSIMLLSLPRNITFYILISAISYFIGNLSWPAFYAWVADLMGRRMRSRGFGLTSASFGIGSVIGPIIGSLAWAAFKPNYIASFSITTIFMLLTVPLIGLLKEDKNMNK